MATWRKGGTKTLCASGDTINICDYTPLSFNMLMMHYMECGGDANIGLRFNDCSGCQYNRRAESDGGADVTTCVEDDMFLNTGLPTSGFTIVFNSGNLRCEEKLITWSYVGNNADGASNIPLRRQGVGKWFNMCCLIDTSMSITNNQGGSFKACSNLSTLGIGAIADDTFASMYESRSALCVVQKQHFVCWFSGSGAGCNVPHAYWSFSHLVGSGGTAIMLDEIDGGFEINAPTGANNLPLIKQGCVGQYNCNGAISISVWKGSKITSGSSTHSGFQLDCNTNAAFGSIAPTLDAVNFAIRNINCTTTSCVALDTNYHVHKVEVRACDMLYYVDSCCVSATHTGTLPTAPMQVAFWQQSHCCGGATQGNIRYTEAYNT